MAITRLTNLISTRNGRMLYVNPDDFNATDAISNNGNSPTRPFKTIQRALLEVARFSYVAGSGNDKYDQFTINLSPGDYIIDNRPGLGSVAVTPELSDQSNFDVLDPNNDLYKFNSESGGLVIPRGTSIVGMDLRKTRVRPRYVPNPLDQNLPVTSIFKVTGACYFWQFSLFDALPLGTPDGLGGVYNNPNSTQIVNADYSHHKVTCFVYASQEDLDLYYAKSAKAFASIPDSTSELSSRTQENRIVGPLQQAGQKDISAIVVTGSNATITANNHEIFDGQQITIENIIGTYSDLNGTYYVSDVIDENTFRISQSSISLLPSGSATSGDLANAILKAEIDTVDSSSPYIFNCSLRSTYGLCGLWADGSKVTGFKSMVVAQFTGVSLQKDDNAFLKFTETTTSPAGNPSPSFVLEGGASDSVSLHQDASGGVYYRQDWRHYHIRVSNSSFIQSVSVFAVGYAEQHLIESGGDYSITNSNSNFGTSALIADGFRSDAFALDKKGYISHIVPPQSLSTVEAKVPYYPLDIQASKEGITPGGTGERIYLFAQTDPESTPVFNINLNKFGGRVNDKIYVNLTSPTDGKIQEYSATISPNGIEEHVVTAINPQTNIFTTSVNNNFETGTPIRIYSSNGYLPLGMEPNRLYYAVRVSSTQFKIAPSEEDARAGAGGSNTSIVNVRSEKSNTATIVVKAFVGDTNTDLPKFDIIVNASNDLFSTTPYNHGFTTGDKIFFNRRRLEDGSLATGTLPQIQSGGLTASDLDLTVEYNVIVINSKEFRIATTEANAVSGNFIPVDTNGDLNTIRVYKNIQKSPLKYDPDFLNGTTRPKGWYISVDPGVTNQIHPVLSDSSSSNIYLNPALSNTENSYLKRIPDNRSNADRTYRLRYVLPKTELNCRPPINGYVLRRKTDNDNNIIPYNTQTTSNLTSDFERIYYIYKINTIFEHIPNEQDGVYYLTILLADVPPQTTKQFNTPSDTFSFLGYSQDVARLYPDLDKDNPASDPPAAVSVGDNLTHGWVYQNDTRSSITKEAVQYFIQDCGYSPTLSSIPGTAVSGQEARLIAFSTAADVNIQIELRRTSQVRAGNQTFEYTGFGSGNYSTGFPSKQEEVLDDRKVLYSQAQRRRAGVVFYSGLNAYGDLYVGNQKINAVTGEVEILDEPVLTVAGDVAVGDEEYVPYVKGTKNVEIQGNLVTNGIQGDSAGTVVANVFNNESKFNEGATVSTKDPETVNRALISHDLVLRPKAIPLDTPIPASVASPQVKQTYMSLNNIRPNPGVESKFRGDVVLKNNITSTSRHESYIYTGGTLNGGWVQTGLIGVGHLTSIEESYQDLGDITDVIFQSTPEPYRVTGKFGINKTAPTASFHVGTGNSIFDNDVTISGNAIIQKDLAVNGGDITSTSTNFNLLNEPSGTVTVFSGATTVYAFTDALTADILVSANDIDLGSSTGTLKVHNANVVFDGDVKINGCDLTTDCTSFNILNQPTVVSGFTSATTLVFAATSGTTTIRNNLQIDGNLRVSGTTTRVNSTVTTIQDPVITIGGAVDNAVLTSNDGKDRGVEFRYYDDVATLSKIGFYGWDNSDGKYRFLKDATNTNEVFTGTDAELQFGKFTVTDATDGFNYNVNPFSGWNSTTKTYTTATQNANENFQKLIEKYSNPVGTIQMWSGNETTIPEGWCLCDGSTKTDRDGNSVATPDLRERFIVGAGGINSTVNSTDTGGATSGYSAGATGSSFNEQNFVTSNPQVNGGAWSPSITGSVAGHILTRAEIPSHQHGINHSHKWPHASATSAQTGSVSNGEGDAVTVVTAIGFSDANTLYTDSTLYADSSGGARPNTQWSGKGNGNDPGILNDLGDGSHSHGSNFTLSGMTHQHAFSIDKRPPYYALCFIFKL
jgi:hypothetical protein